MKIRFFFCWVLASLLLAAPACAGQGASRADDAVYQVSTINSLLEGVYDGVVRCGDLPRHGDTGIGTFDRLDGEMIVLDGVVYQARSDGRVVRVKPSVTSPFAMVTRFSSDDSWMTTSVQSLDGLQNSIRSRLENPNVFYAVRVDGEFDFVKVRSVPAQSKPYPRLSEAAKEQKVFEFHNVTGTLVGYWSPCWVGTMGFPDSTCISSQPIGAAAVTCSKCESRKPACAWTKRRTLIWFFPKRRHLPKPTCAAKTATS